ncbi:DcuS/MalK family sensor histidine kinase [Sporosarcina pasteurii]|uniref:histidine kinase n=1 Tax=Sporosarcina pasteurii TaxID=1474 RepID=A0A380C2N2_SPOPA|nr:DcuS/MalK family sensor histidine kinase [Sporosarcina pasteurii]MDS9471572.1 DcuS/MalK family sensor histidine kinase [Sporosarcina pasteurii]QBQ04813.1 two-component system sensor histidine kinase DcuS [Sporosarcina pasteurii]SUJ11151.1 Sensor histidine kinase DcuS [Sporosarcina pasteurii]
MSKNKNVSLQTKLTVLVCTVVLIAIAVTAYLIGNKAIANSKEFHANKVMDLAKTISHTQLIQDGLIGKESPDKIQTFTKSVQEETGVEYIVVLNKEHIRLSHPVGERIGEYFVGGDEDRAYEGESYTSTAHGTLGESLRAFVPIYHEHELVGVVSVGVLSENIQAAVFESLKTIYIAIGVGLLVGIIGAFLLARQVKKTLYGLEPKDIAKRLGERDAMLESVKEGILAMNDEGEIIVANQAANQIFQKAGITESLIGQQADAFPQMSALKEVLQTGNTSLDEQQNLNGIEIVVNRVPVVLNGKIVGALATFRDKTELTSLVEQLSSAKSFAEILRVQTHEFMNKLHVISAMVHTKSYEELQAYTTYISSAYQQEVGAVSRLVKDPVLSGFLVNKLSEARKFDIEIDLTGERPLPALKNIVHMDKIITIVGNLFDNASEAVRDQTFAHIEMTVHYENNFFYFDIRDNGPGLNENEASQIGISTKGENRGYGLYLINKALNELGGTIKVTTSKDTGTEFNVKIPYEGDIHD